jgi:1-acyl-sn-glycerol-3-phosphate acyltransferase
VRRDPAQTLADQIGTRLSAAVAPRLRGLGVGFFLAVIGLGGTLIALLVFPPLHLLARTPVQRQRWSQLVLRVSFWLYCWLIRAARVAEIEIVGGEKLADLRGALVIANHPSLLDVVMIMSALPRAQCIVKGGLWRHPFFRLTVSGAGYIRNDLDPEALLEACAATLAAGNNLIVFPEGTRTSPGCRPVLGRGFAIIAAMTNVNIQPIILTCDPPLLFKGNPWWRAPQQKPRFRMEVEELVTIVPLQQGGMRSIAARRIVDYFDQYFTEKLGYG